MMVNMAPKIQTNEQVEYYERILKIMANVFIIVTDETGGAIIREAVMNREKSILEAIEKKQMETVKKKWAEAEVVLLTFVEMERYPQMLRMTIRTVFRCALALPQVEGDALITKYLDDVTLELAIRPGHWHKKIIYIEMANCVYANGYKQLYPYIKSKVAELHRELEDNPNITVHETIMKQFEKLRQEGARTGSGIRMSHLGGSTLNNIFVL